MQILVINYYNLFFIDLIEIYLKVFINILYLKSFQQFFIYLLKLLYKLFSINTKLIIEGFSLFI